MNPVSDPDIKKVKALVLDLGGVLIDIDPELTTKAFSELGASDALKKHSRAVQDPLFDRFERGETGPDEFRKGIREKSGIQASDEEIDRAWNALLLEIPRPRFHLLEKLEKEYELHLFSNTNLIHFEAFSEMVDSTYGMAAFRKLFQGIHLSYEMGVRKPEERAFRLLLDRVGHAPAQTLFIDDTEAHVKAAREQGIRSWHLAEKDLLGLEKELLPQDLS